jgi:hypothetical protein
VLNKKVLLNAIVAGAVVASGSANAASNWVRNEGDVMYMADLQYQNASTYWDRTGVVRGIADSVGNPCTSSNLNLFQGVEYGASYYYTLFGGVSVGKHSCGVDSVSGVGDAELGVRGRLNPAENGKSWEAKLTLPTGYNRNNYLRMGYGRVGLELGVHYGGTEDPYSADPYMPGYAPPSDSHWEYGAMVRTWEGPPASSVGAYGKWVTLLPQEWTFAAMLEGSVSLGHGKPEPIVNAAFPRQPWSDVLKAKVEFKHLIADGWVFSVSPGLSLWGRNTPRSRGISFGIHKLFAK